MWVLFLLKKEQERRGCVKAPTFLLIQEAFQHRNLLCLTWGLRQVKSFLNVPGCSRRASAQVVCSIVCCISRMLLCVAGSSLAGSCT